MSPTSHIDDDRRAVAIEWALRRIAYGDHTDPGRSRRSRLSHAEIQLIARDACDLMGWSYDRKMVEDYCASRKPDGAPPIVPSIFAEISLKSRRSRKLKEQPPCLSAEQLPASER